MKAIFLGRYDGTIDEGVSRKMLGQIEGLRRLPFEVEAHVVGSTPDPRWEDHGVQYHQIPAMGGSVFRKVSSLKSYLRAVSSILSRTGSGDLVYLRGMLPLPGFRKALRSSRGDVIIELPSNAIGEARSRGSLTAALLLKLFGRSVMTAAKGIVVVTHDIAEAYGLSGDSRVYVMGNGIARVARSFHRQPPPDNLIRLTFVSKLTRYRGLDRLLEGLRRYDGERRIVLNVVGDGPALAELQAQAKGVQGPHEIRFHGFLSGESLENVYRATDIGVAGIGGYRKGMRCSSSLKSREYCAYGIPFVYAGDDPELVELKPHVYEVPNDSSPIDVSEVVSFYDRCAFSGAHARILSFARERLLWDAKMAGVVNQFFPAEPASVQVRN